MKVYKFKCKDCGATKYERNGNIYKCQYCGYTEEVYGEQTEELKPAETKEPITPSVVVESKMEKTQVSILVRMVVCFIAGYLGIHKFLEGKVGLGILYLFTGGLFGIGYIVDCITLFFGFLSSVLKSKNSKGEK